MTARYSEVDAVVAYIKRHLDEPLSLTQLARHAAYSPYHFTRIFKEQIGLSPQYYIASLRLQRAKDLLLRTNLSIRDIGLEIGQQSLGTFTTRFTERVGMTPSHFRNSTPLAHTHFQSLRRLDDWRTFQPIPIVQDACVAGTIKAVVPFQGFVLIGLFERPIPEGLPLHGTLISSLGEFCLTGVKPGTYYLMATSVSWSMQAIDFLLPHATLRTRSHEPIVVTPGSGMLRREVTLYPPSSDDPPILVSLPLLMNNFLNRVGVPVSR